MATEARAPGWQSDAARMASELARQASVEVGGVAPADFEQGRPPLAAGRRVFVSHLPGQQWRQTLAQCSRLSAAGLDPVPHIPVRLLTDTPELDRVLRAARAAGVREPLLISGDYPEARGRFSSVLEVLATGSLQANGFQRVSLAGHPEGHPRVPWDVICESQVMKWRRAMAEGLAVTFVTQFFFTLEPFVNWARLLRAAGVDARLVAGVAGPTGLAPLIKLATRCGVGPSLRALTARPSSVLRLLTDYSPESLLGELAALKLQEPRLFDGLHVFSLGGVQRTMTWLERVSGA